MPLDPATVKRIYSGVTAKHYDLPMSHLFGKYKRLAVEESSIKQGDTVLVFCCGTGLDFASVQRRIGSEGKIVGVDFSPQMLEVARRRARRKKWENVELVEADVTQFGDTAGRKFDVGVCTLGVSIIPDYQAAYRNLVSHVKPGGGIVIGDMQLASGGFARLNPVTVLMARRYGGTYEGHRNSVELYSLILQDLVDVRKREFFFRSYFYCVGKIKQAD